MLEKEFVPYEQAVALKSIGFDKPCLAKYQKLSETANYQFQLLQKEINCNKLDTAISRPTYSTAFRWFRDKHKLHATITSISQESWQWRIQEPGQKLGELYNEDYYYYEEAELECLKELIEIVKNK
jgi:hypothetical protein